MVRVISEIEVLCVVDTEDNTKQNILVTDASNMGTEKFMDKVLEILPPSLAFTRKKLTKELEKVINLVWKGECATYKEYEIFWETVELY